MSGRKEFRDLASPEEAHETIAGLDIGGGSETVPLAEANGRVLAERVDAGLDVPGFDRSGLDGYALRARDTFGASEGDPVALSVVGTVEAGQRPATDPESGEAVEIATGAVMPDGADAMVPVERTNEADGTVRVDTAVTPGENVMAAGADIAAGERALGPGTRLTAREIGLLSALGIDEVPVRASPRVGIVSTGDELVRPGEELDSGRGQIYDVNSYTTAAGVREAGGEPVLYPHAGDDMDAMEQVLRKAADECDLVLSSGSTSASAVDVVYRVIDEQGELLLHGVAIKPGKPMLVGRLDEAAYVGLPGYPVSALSIFRTFVAPAIRRAAGLPEPETATVEARMSGRERYEGGRRRLVPVGLVTNGDGKLLAAPVDKGSGATTSLVEADGIVAMPADVNYLDEGERVMVELFSPDVRPPTLFGVGEDDPLFSRLLDRLDRPRYLRQGSRGGQRYLRDGVTDIGVSSIDTETGTEIGGWTREWGLVVPDGNPEDVTGLGELVDEDLRFVNRPTESGLRTSLGNALAELADERGVERHELVEAIDGFEFTVQAHESPARRVLAGDADVGLGLRATAANLDCGFVPIGTERVRVLANPERTGKAGVEKLDRELDEIDELLDELPGYGR
ncbi:molybdopterin biosynthesis protein MoeA/LysR substrate binding-domain-containing protein [Halococcus morrhuae DSM 1307]|uniref:Molybdopterin biosynthesis protein MoeA/LysR substrate binding-domain-containing protein n=1 Tax=Halococcus morrhuae DSM 1307 TaxID=931277 RepID=M0MUE0_HALMO|nr:molybdopterin biosynthesis protein [Halococcus morrhuae]EMA48389.1 molybdopterin biosynthesis protein MoeA/LysR substrate binding-domain-containing protein [Halococcus morrhuae DSM 1307]